MHQGANVIKNEDVELYKKEIITEYQNYIGVFFLAKISQYCNAANFVSVIVKYRRQLGRFADSAFSGSC